MHVVLLLQNETEKNGEGLTVTTKYPLLYLLQMCICFCHLQSYKSRNNLITFCFQL